MNRIFLNFTARRRQHCFNNVGAMERFQRNFRSLDTSRDLNWNESGLRL